MTSRELANVQCRGWIAQEPLDALNVHANRFEVVLVVDDGELGAVGADLVDEDDMVTTVGGPVALRDATTYRRKVIAWAPLVLEMVRRVAGEGQGVVEGGAQVGERVMVVDGDRGLRGIGPRNGHLQERHGWRACARRDVDGRARRCTALRLQIEDGCRLWSAGAHECGLPRGRPTHSVAAVSRPPPESALITAPAAVHVQLPLRGCSPCAASTARLQSAERPPRHGAAPQTCVLYVRHGPGRTPTRCKTCRSATCVGCSGRRLYGFPSMHVRAYAPDRQDVPRRSRCLDAYAELGLRTDVLDPHGPLRTTSPEAPPYVHIGGTRQRRVYLLHFSSNLPAEWAVRRRLRIGLGGRLRRRPIGTRSAVVGPCQTSREAAHCPASLCRPRRPQQAQPACTGGAGDRRRGLGSLSTDRTARLPNRSMPSA